jgi:hypothetical protein
MSTTEARPARLLGALASLLGRRETPRQQRWRLLARNARKAQRI